MWMTVRRKVLELIDGNFLGAEDVAAIEATVNAGCRSSGR